MAGATTEKQKKVAIELQKNLTRNPVKNSTDLLEEVGYAKNTARHKQKTIINSQGVQEELKPFLKKLEKERDRLIKAISIKNLKDVDYEKATNSLDKIVKNIQLLSGKPTDNLHFNLIEL